MKKLISFFIVITGVSILAFSQSEQISEHKIDSLKRLIIDMRHRFDILEKQIDDVLWFQRVGDICTVDKVFIYGPPAANIADSSEVGALNPVRFWSYVFIPHSLRHGKKYPLIILPHGGVHSNFSTYYTHIVRELMVQGYIVIAPEYRGSTGYGKKFYELIDYGGLETGDTDASRQYMIDNYPFVDSDRVGIMGWSHGGMIALMCLFHYPDHYKVGFAGVPVSDLIMRIGYRGQEYEKYFSASYHIGQTVAEAPEEYRRRSPVSHAAKLHTPLILHTNTNDDDVYAIEVIELIKALKDAERDFIYNIYEDLPGGHGFDRIDTKLARSIRFKMYQFLAAWLNPPCKFKNVQQLETAAYPGMKPKKSGRKK
jgi:dipeptidyl aminopeptidase/acylaminoacyl peptidase